MIPKELACTSELIDFEKSVIEFNNRLDGDLRRLAGIINWDGIGRMSEETLLLIYDKLVEETRILRERQRQRGGALLMSAVEVSNRVIGVEKAYRGME